MGADGFAYCVFGTRGGFSIVGIAQQNQSNLEGPESGSMNLDNAQMPFKFSDMLHISLKTQDAVVCLN